MSTSIGKDVECVSKCLFYCWNFSFFLFSFFLIQNQYYSWTQLVFFSFIFNRKEFRIQGRNLLAVAYEVVWTSGVSETFPIQRCSVPSIDNFTSYNVQESNICHILFRKRSLINLKYTIPDFTWNSALYFMLAQFSD